MHERAHRIFVLDEEVWRTAALDGIDRSF